LSSIVPPIIHIVDDDAQVRAATSYLLAGQGYSTEVYASGEEFLAEGRLGEGCVLLDMRMPGLSGLDVLARFAERGISVPVIMMSGHGDLDVAVRAMKLGAVDFFEKPYEKHALIAAIERALDLSARASDRKDGKAAARVLLQRLSPRERQILQGLLAGMSNKTIARRLELSHRTVEMHRANMMDDLGLTSLSEALRLAIDADLTPLDGGSAEAPRPPAAAGLPAKGRPAPRDKGPAEAPLAPILDVLEGTTDCVYLLDREWRFTYLNANAMATIGLGRHLIGANIWEAFPLAVGTKGWDELHRAAADRQPVRFEFFEPDVECWFDVSVRPVPTGLQIFFRDITPQRRAKAALQISEETLLLALDAAGDGAWDWNVATGDVVMSPRFLERLGYAPESFPGRFGALRYLVHPEDWEMLSTRLDDHVDGRTESFSCEYRLRRSDGGWLWNFDRGRVVARDPQSGAALRMVGSACDVTERKQAEALAGEAFERIALAQKNAGAGTWDLDLEARRLELCPRSLAMHGLAADGPGRLTEEAWQASVHPEDLAGVVEALERAVATGGTFSTQYRTIDPEGGCRWVVGLGKLAAGTAGRPPRFVGLNLEATQWMEAAVELNRVQAELLHLSRLSATGAVASMLAHELNQPLTAIAAYVGGLRRALGHDGAGEPGGGGEGDGEEARRAAMAAIEGAENSALYAAGIVRRLRDQAGRGAAERKRESLTETIRDICRLSAEHLPCGAAPVLHIDPGADAILVDRVQIEQVLLNLIRNACEAMAESGADAPVTISARPAEDGFAEIRVCDGGAGVPEARKPDIFSPSISGKAQGMGIGLSICRTLVEAHGGRIWVEDNQPAGACFCFTLPLAAD
jgi:two-component system sensor kinase FixL